MCARACVEGASCTKSSRGSESIPPDPTVGSRALSHRVVEHEHHATNRHNQPKAPRHSDPTRNTHRVSPRPRATRRKQRPARRNCASRTRGTVRSSHIYGAKTSCAGASADSQERTVSWHGRVPGRKMGEQGPARAAEAQSAGRSTPHGSSNRRSTNPRPLLASHRAASRGTDRRRYRAAPHKPPVLPRGWWVFWLSRAAGHARKATPDQPHAPAQRRSALIAGCQEPLASSGQSSQSTEVQANPAAARVCDRAGSRSRAHLLEIAPG